MTIQNFVTKAIDDTDPLSVLIVPHEVVEWQKKKGLLMQRHLPHVVKAEKERGKYAVFHDKLRLNGLFDSKEQALSRIEEIVGDKRRCIENKRIFHIKQL